MPNMKSPFGAGPRPGYLDEICDWPLSMRAVLSTRTREFVELGNPRREAEFIAWSRIMRGCYPLPPISVDAPAPAWADRLPTAVTVRFSA